MPSIPYPVSFDRDVNAERAEERYNTAFRTLDAGDILATADSKIAQEISPEDHPLHSIVAFYLRHKGTDVGTRPHTLQLVAERLDELVREAIDEAVELRLATMED